MRKMVYGAIDEHSREQYTFLKDVFTALKDTQRELNWLITDSEVIAQSEEFERFNVGGYHFLSGDELTDLVIKDDGQWIWGVLSGFDKRIALEDILQHPLPYAIGYNGFWKNPLSLQHPLASVEIVPWDSSRVLLLSTQNELIDLFRLSFSASADLSTYNTRRH